jgi:hypothetical protein
MQCVRLTDSTQKYVVLDRFNMTLCEMGRGEHIIYIYSMSLQVLWTGDKKTRIVTNYICVKYEVLSQG